MPAFICNTCGTQFTPSDKEPARCPICDEERQFVPPSGQIWTTHEALARRYTNTFRQHELGLIGIGTVPAMLPALSARYYARCRPGRFCQLVARVHPCRQL
jgi:uncharacterized OB-fold protein